MSNFTSSPFGPLGGESCPHFAPFLGETLTSFYAKLCYEEGSRPLAALLTDSPHSPLGLAGAAIAMIFSALGAAYGTAKSGIGISGLGQVKPEL